MARGGVRSWESRGAWHGFLVSVSGFCFWVSLDFPGAREPEPVSRTSGHVTRPRERQNSILREAKRSRQKKLSLRRHVFAAFCPCFDSSIRSLSFFLLSGILQRSFFAELANVVYRRTDTAYSSPKQVSLNATKLLFIDLEGDIDT